MSTAMNGTLRVSVRPCARQLARVAPAACAVRACPHPAAPRARPAAAPPRRRPAHAPRPAAAAAPAAAPAASQRYILAMRVKELTEVLDRLGMRKGGRKAELQTRVMSVFASDAATT